MLRRQMASKEGRSLADESTEPELGTEASRELEEPGEGPRGEGEALRRWAGGTPKGL